MEEKIERHAQKKAPAPGVLSTLSIPPERWGNARLIKGILEGDPEAANIFFDRYADLINRRVRFLLGRANNHEDVVQRVYLALIDSIDTVRNPDALKGWIIRVSTFVVSKELRRKKRARWLTYVSEIPEISVSGDQDAGVLIPRVRAVLQKMKKTDRIVFVMRFVEELDVVEIADAFSWSITTTRRRIARARDLFLKRAMRDPALASFQEELSNER